tara:strand:+ start:7287 stop:8735 length:1449 start_codon:yes stop_codon:yes gene_type:complete
MPKVKTIRPGRLSGISGLAREAAQGVKYNKDVEYAYELEKWREQDKKIKEVQKQEQDTISENLKLIAGKELGVDGFNESVRNQMMDLAVKTARANSKMKLGDLDPMQGAKEVASYENVLDVFQTSIPNIAALSDKIINAPESGANSILLPADPTQAAEVKNIVQIVTDMNSPERNSQVEYSVIDGKSMVKHKETGQEISLKGLNDIMSGKNPQYPIKFVPDFTQAAKPIVETMLREKSKNFTKQVDVTTYDPDGTKRTVKKNKTLTGDGSNYKTELTAAMDLMMNDKENMPGYWADLTRDLPVNERTPWLNTDEQRKEAISLMYTAADNAWGPKTNVETTSESTIEQKPSTGDVEETGISKGKKGKRVSHDHNNWIEQNILAKQKVVTRYPTGDVEEEQELTLEDKRRKVLERIRLFSPSKFAYGDDPRVAMKSADPNKLYELKSVTGGYNAIEVPISDKDLMNKTKLNKFLIDYSKKYDVI